MIIKQPYNGADFNYFLNRRHHKIDDAEVWAIDDYDYKFIREQLYIFNQKNLLQPFKSVKDYRDDNLDDFFERFK